MRRITCDPRPGWSETVVAQGLIYPTTTHSDGRVTPYWDESAYYELTSAEVDTLERVTQELHEMCLAAAAHLASGALGTLGLPKRALELARASLAARPPSLYGRFDIAWDGTGQPKLLEYNADTPTGLVEASVAQWFWLEDRFPEADQWNSLHERLVAGWQRHRRRFPTDVVHFAYSAQDTSGEEFMTVTYLQDTAEQAGLRGQLIEMRAIGYDPSRRLFVDLDEAAIAVCFKLYPWELMLSEEFGGFVRVDDAESAGTIWIEPLWKVVLSNKALLAALWELYPGHPNIVPAYLDGPRDLVDWVAKPLHGREGANIRIHAPTFDLEITQPGEYGSEGYCYQHYVPLPDAGGHTPVLGCWIVDGYAAGLGIRESDGPVTDDAARFVPHLIAAPRPRPEEQAAWIDADHPLSERIRVDAVPRHGGDPAPSPTALPVIPTDPPSISRSPT